MMLIREICAMNNIGNETGNETKKSSFCFSFRLEVLVLTNERRNTKVTDEMRSQTETPFSLYNQKN